MINKKTKNLFIINNIFISLNNLICNLSFRGIIIIQFCLLSSIFANTVLKSTNTNKWVGTWSTAPQLVEPGNNPPSPGLSYNSLRQVVRVSIGGDTLRMRFSNEFSNSPIKLNSVHIAFSKGNGVIDTTTDKVIYFSGQTDVTIERGSAVMSDPFQFSVPPLTDLAITIYFGNTPSDLTGHPGSRTTSYILTGNNVMKEDFSNAVRTDHWYVINTIEVLSPETASAISILGNSITDGRGSGTNKQNRWPDELARRLQSNNKTKQVAVLNSGIGGNCVLKMCLGPSALNRFERDVLNQNGVKWLIILEGINDIGGASGSQGSAKVAQDLISAYEQMIDRAHAKGIIVYGATLLPFGGSSYDSPDHQNAWRTVNDWIRNSGRFDGVIDFATALSDPANPTKLLPIADTGDHLHPNETGHRMMAETIDLTLFGAETNTGYNEKSTNVPIRYSLLQNFPNPFNASTRILYRVTKECFVSLRVFDSLGSEISLLVDELKSAGNYEISFNASNLPSGTYYYKLAIENFSEFRKMILLK